MDQATPNNNSTNCNEVNEQPALENPLDSDSIVSDRCWVPRYKSDSRKWLLRDGYPEHMRTQDLSTMKDSFGQPLEENLPVIGRRAKILLERMRREAEVEVIAERHQQPTIEAYITTYDDTYCSSDPNFYPRPLPRGRDLYEKYPLYSNPGTSFWMHQHTRHVAARPEVGGAAMKVDFNQPFKRNTQFSKPLEDVADGFQLDR